MTGAAKNTVTKLVVEFGEFAAWYQDKTLRNLKCTELQLDEIWSFCGCKEKNKGTAKNPQVGDIWTWTALCRDTKLVPSWLVSDRGHSAAREIVDDLASRLANREKPMTMEELIALFDEFRAEMYPVNRPLRYRPRSNRETYTPIAPLTPWYLDPESGGPNPPADQGKQGIKYQDEESSN